MLTLAEKICREKSTDPAAAPFLYTFHFAQKLLAIRPGISKIVICFVFDVRSVAQSRRMHVQNLGGCVHATDYESHG